MTRKHLMKKRKIIGSFAVGLVESLCGSRKFMGALNVKSTFGAQLVLKTCFAQSAGYFCVMIVRLVLTSFYVGHVVRVRFFIK